MTALSKWRPDPDSPIKAGYQCGNPKCQAVRGASNHWFMAWLRPDIHVVLSPWHAPAFIGAHAEFMVPLCGEQCATELLNLWLSERTAEAMQSTKVGG